MTFNRTAPYDWASALLAVASRETHNLPELVALAQLDPKGDIQDIDLSNIDLRDQDLRGYDLRFATFEGTNLSGTDLRGAQVSATSLIAARNWKKALLDAPLRGAANTIELTKIMNSIPAFYLHTRGVESLYTAAYVLAVPIVLMEFPRAAAERILVRMFEAAPDYDSYPDAFRELIGGPWLSLTPKEAASNFLDCLMNKGEVDLYQLREEDLWLRSSKSVTIRRGMVHVQLRLRLKIKMGPGRTIKPARDTPK